MGLFNKILSNDFSDNLLKMTKNKFRVEIKSDRQINPFARSCTVCLPMPDLSDNRGDDRRLKEAVSEVTGIADIVISLPVLREISGKLRAKGFSVEVVLVYNGYVWEVAEIRNPDDMLPLYGLAIDLGSTGIVFYLTDLKTGEVIDVHSITNPQIPYGEDILTRIYLAHTREGLIKLQDAVLQGLKEAVLELEYRNNFTMDSIFAMVVAGNTTMVHFFLGLSIETLCREPYIPAANRPGVIRNGEILLPMHKHGICYVLPNVGSYFGGDLLAGIIISEIYKSKDISVFLDVGTNAEAVIGNQDMLVVAAGSAGPGLEGGILEHGMRAQNGAVDSVQINGKTLEISLSSIGNTKARGLCGSGAIDLLAQLLLAGLVDQSGTLRKERWPDRVIETENGLAFVLVQDNETLIDNPITFSQRDINNLLRSKGAMYAILTVLARTYGISFEEINRFYVAGNFGNHINPESAISIGMLPEIPVERFTNIGNASGLGAVHVLLSIDDIDIIPEILEKIFYVEMNVQGDFMNELTASLFLPHTNRALFPGVWKRIEG